MLGNSQWTGMLATLIRIATTAFSLIKYEWEIFILDVIIFYAHNEVIFLARYFFSTQFSYYTRCSVDNYVDKKNVVKRVVYKCV